MITIRIKLLVHEKLYIIISVTFWLLSHGTLSFYKRSDCLFNWIIVLLIYFKFLPIIYISLQLLLLKEKKILRIKKSFFYLFQFIPELVNSLFGLTNIPCFFSHSKYLIPCMEPSFLPFSDISSKPIHVPNENIIINFPSSKVKLKKYRRTHGKMSFSNITNDCSMSLINQFHSGF